VSSDIVKTHASTVDLSMTRVVDGDLLKVMTWYDNEWGFTNQMIRQILAELASLQDKFRLY
jgi:glyceraldehyde 3-phosphate dehydrogenase